MPFIPSAAASRPWSPISTSNPRQQRLSGRLESTSAAWPSVQQQLSARLESTPAARPGPSPGIHSRTSWYGLTENGTDWSAGDPLGVPLSAFQVLAWAAYGNALLFILVFFGEEGLRFATSQNGSDWDVPDYTLDISLPDGGSVQVYTIGEEKFHLYSSGDGTYRQYRVEYSNGPSGDAFIVEPIIESVIPELGVNQVLAVQAPEIDETDESLERFLIVAFTIATL